MSNIDVTSQIMKNYQLDDAALASKWGSDVKSKMGIGSAIGGLIGKYGVPALAGALMSTGVGAPLGIALSIAGAAGGSYLGSTIGRELAGDADKGMGTQTNALRRLDAMFDDTRDAGALTAGATAGASALSMGADKYMAHLADPLGLTPTTTDAMKESILAGKDKVSILDLVKKTGTVTPGAGTNQTGINYALNAALDKLIAGSTQNQVDTAFKQNNEFIQSDGLMQYVPSETTRVDSIQGLDRQYPMIDKYYWDKYINSQANVPPINPRYGMEIR